ncbi:MAG: alpha/beta hydrolase [Betaproteobacteria bacterium]|nr:MAG: alpha/beta hydrolase [Betaproteobacteria bacterium]
MPMPFLDLPPELRLYYEIDDWTDAWTRPQSVLLVHGFTETTTAWRGWVPHLARRYRVIRFDQRGFGQTGPVPREFDFSTDLLADDLVRVINALAGEPVHVIAGKSGGICASRLAATRPDLVRTLTLASCPLLPPQADGWLEHMDSRGMRSWARSTMAARLGSRMPPRGIDWWVDMMGATAVSTAHAYLRWVVTIDVRPDLPKIACPTLVLTTESTRRSEAELNAYREGLRRGELVKVPIDGYHAAGSAPDESARIALDFIDRHAGAS